MKAMILLGVNCGFGNSDCAGLTFTEKTVLTVQLEDRPGTLAELAKKLGAAGVNITSLVPIGARGGTVQLAIGVDDVEKARRVV